MLIEPKFVVVKDFNVAMDVLSYWRFSHEEALEEALNVLKTTTLKFDKSAICAKRLKRHPSIVYKLNRFKKITPHRGK